MAPGSAKIQRDESASWEQEEDDSCNIKCFLAFFFPDERTFKIRNNINKVSGLCHMIFYSYLVLNSVLLIVNLKFCFKADCWRFWWASVFACTMMVHQQQQQPLAWNAMVRIQCVSEIILFTDVRCSFNYQKFKRATMAGIREVCRVSKHFHDIHRYPDLHPVVHRHHLHLHHRLHHRLPAVALHITTPIRNRWLKTTAIIEVKVIMLKTELN